MRQKIEEILIRYKKDIQEVENGRLDDFSNVEKGIQISRLYIQKLRVVLRNSKFKSNEDEITFFKKQKPYIYGRLKFYAKLYKFASQRPLGSIKSQRRFIDNEIQLLQNYFQKNADFTNYFRQDKTNLDEYFFLRGNDQACLISDTLHFYADQEFSTSHDSSVAKIIAYDLLLNYYMKEIEKIQVSNIENKSRSKRYYNEVNLSWTATKIDLIELIYALQSSGAIKSGMAGIKEMALVCEKVFDVDLGNFYRKFLEIKARKTERTKFLDRMKSTLLKRMEDADE